MSFRPGRFLLSKFVSICVNYLFTRPTLTTCFYWLGDEDSNLDKRSQRKPCAGIVFNYGMLQWYKFTHRKATPS